MSDLINLTIRIDANLKKDAELACAYLNTTISNAIRNALTGLVRQYHQTKVQDAGLATRSMESESCQRAYQLIIDFMELNGNEFKIDENGRLIFNGKPKE